MNFIQTQIKQKALTYILVSCTIWFITCSTLTAQELGSMRFGLEIAPMITWLKSDNPQIDNNARPGFQYGMTFDYFFSDNYAFSTGLQFGINKSNQIGRIQQMDTMDVLLYSSNEKVRLNFIEVPLTVLLQTNEMGYVTYYVQFGLVPSFNVRGRTTFEQPLDTVAIENVNLRDSDNPSQMDAKNVNLGFTIGGGIIYSIAGKTSIFGGIFFNNGFLSVLDDGDDEKTSLKSVALRAGIFF